MGKILKGVLSALALVALCCGSVHTGYAQDIPMTIGGVDSNGSRHAFTSDANGSQIIGGRVASGAAPTSGWYPLWIGGWDGTNVYPLKVDTLGQLLTGRASAAVTLLATTVDTTGAGHTVTDAVGITGLGKYRQIQILLNVTAAATAASDTLDVYIDTSPDSGTTWVNCVHMTQVLGNGGAKQFWATLDTTTPGTSVIAVTSDAAAGVVRPAMFTDRLRVRYVTVDGGSADTAFTLAVTAFAKA